MSNQPLAVVLANFKTKWNPGWDTCFAHRSVGKERIYLMNSLTGKVQSRDILNTKRIADRPNWRRGFGAYTDSILCYTVGSKSYLMYGNSTTGRVKIYPIDSAKGELGSPTFQQTWSIGWDNFVTYELGGKHFLVIVKSSTGDIHIHELTSDGKVGTRTYDSKINSFWKIARTYTVGGKVFFFLINPSNSKVQIYEMTSTGKIQNEVINYDWTNGWDVVDFYTVGTKVFLFLLKSSNGQVHIHQMNADGKVGPRTYTSDWSSGWTSATFYNAGSNTCMSLIKASTGQGHTHIMEENGTVGIRINPTEPLSKSFVEEQLTYHGRGKDLLNDYFQDISRGSVNLKPSFVTDWLTIQDSWENVKEKGRFDKADIARKLAEQKGYAINSTQSVVVIHSEPGDSGASGRYVLAHPEGLSLEFFAHEVLHTWDLGHSFSDDQSVPHPWGNLLAWGVYDNPWDIMSAMNSFGYDNGSNKSVGPGLNIFGLEQMGWIHDSYLIDVNPKLSARNYTINSLSVRLNRTEIGLKVPYALGEFFTVEYRTKDEWDQGLPKETALIHQVEASLVPRDASWRGNFGKDWDVFTVYRVNDKSYMLRLKSSNGNVEIDRVEEHGKLSLKVYKSDWTSGWTTAESYEVAGSTYLLILKKGTGDVHLYRINSDGKLGTKILDSRWTAGWSSVKYFIVNGKPYLFLLKESNGHVHIHKLEQNGAIGAEVVRYDWSSGWTDVQFYYQNGACFLALYKRGSGAVHTHRMNSNGTVGSRIDTTSWGKNWDTIHAYGRYSTQLLRLNSTSGKAEFQSSNTSGSLVEVPSDAKLSWSTGWTTAHGFATSAGLYMVIYKKNSGRAEIILMSKARILRIPKSIDSKRPPVQEVNKNGVYIKVISTNQTTRKAIIQVGK